MFGPYLIFSELAPELVAMALLGRMSLSSRRDTLPECMEQMASDS